MSYRFLSINAKHLFGIPLLLMCYVIQAQTSVVNMENMETGKVYQLNTHKPIKYRLNHQPRRHKDYFRTINDGIILLSGDTILGEDLTELRSWAVTKPTRTKITGYLLSGAGLLLSIGALATLDESGEGGYGSITKGLGITLALAGISIGYSGIRMAHFQKFTFPPWSISSAH